MQVKTEAWSISKIIIGALFSMIIAMGLYNFQQQESRISKLEGYAVNLDKDKIGKQELKEAIEGLNQRMDTMVHSVNNMQQLQTQNVLIRIDGQQQMLTRMEHLLNTAVTSKK